jgi:transmembrane sensor
MNASFSARTIESAAAWYARLQAPGCTPSDREAFQRWCAEDPDHAAAYALARDMSARLTRAAATNPRLRAMTEQALAGGRAHGAAARMRRAAGIATALAASVGAAFLGVGMLQTPHKPSAAPQVTRVAARDDERRAVTLEDGTVVQVDVGSELEVRFTGQQREVTLHRGRAVFDVAHDAERPFAVLAGGGRVTAIGTVFQVERNSAEIVVTLAEGIVTVSGEPSGTHRTERMMPGDELSLNAAGNQWVRRTVDPRVATSWSTGRLLFRETPLADALQEVNRYATTKVRLADASLADLPVSGNFVAGDSASAVAAFAAVLPLTIINDGDELRLYRRARERR